ncbi:bifunctional phosphoribosyl-AMP cyclohydrolase/phosphoribosyl-ATP pyrophosphatase [Campylobacter blaseri]|uniref:Histidine biosynthesis bifunctional protein HisIE n=1 Tax=Campylobacter blaseri TaxID=2042961 RepID=A0A2P8R1I2_9BACT|nr:bifunctional phosphoribosyl-AMP cyclohydrolase/phosphoribosyl-ATP pyrophosphatase [Campylobacter blaseri]PSM54131.1 bifunctional phosphoribosyl-AMP cyclohydrolase/phosphoribosyl-ATP pyrophosphatase [Campylobacter blaseri]
MKIDWQKVNGLLPVIVQDETSKDVLMLAYMNKEAFNLTLTSGFAHYFSRTKKRIWKKGEESENTQEVKKIFLDCDNDTLLLSVKQIGVACHTGSKSCFFNEIKLNGEFTKTLNIKKPLNYDVLDELYHIILDRKLNANPETSYVAKVFNRGENAILKKVVEESNELTLACKDLTKFNTYDEFKKEQFGEHIKDNPEYDVVYEASDLVFHLLIALAMHNIHPSRIYDELARRNGISGIEEKKSRKI